MEVREKFELYEKKNIGRAWGREQIMEGLMVDIGDLTKLVMAEEGYRKVDDMDEKLEHKLSDCLWSFIVLSVKCGIDLEKAFLGTTSELDRMIEVNKQM